MKKEKLPGVIVIFILTVITIVFWVSFRIYITVSNNKPVTVSEEILLPVDPKLDTETINQMEGRIYP